MDMSEVKSLKEIALLGVYEYITLSLTAKAEPIKKGPPVKKRRKLLPAAGSGRWSITAEEVDPIEQTKNKLAEYLVGVNCHYREELWKFYNTQSPTKRPTVATFLACVLDSNFTSVELGANHLLQGNLHSVRLYLIN